MIDENGTIWEAGVGRKRQAVGIDSQREQELTAQITEMQEVIDNYYNKLVELGAIEVPKTAEQIAREQAAQQAEINKQLLEAISSLKEEVRAFKGEFT
jgi:F0F1-type ATP synthase membrane subunit b/b'